MISSFVFFFVFFVFGGEMGEEEEEEEDGISSSEGKCGKRKREGRNQESRGKKILTIKPHPKETPDRTSLEGS